MKRISIYFFLFALIGLSACKPTQPNWPANNVYFVYAPNTQIEVSYYDGPNGEHISGAMTETDRYCATHLISASIGSYYPTDLKEHPEWNTFTIKRTQGSSPIYITPYKSTIVNGETEFTFSNESGLLDAKLEKLVNEKYMLKIDDNELHQLPISHLWYQTMATPAENSYPSIQVTK